MPRTFLLIIDGLGVGAQEDALLYGDEKADTLGNVSRIANVNLPNFEKLGLGNIRDFETIRSVDSPIASFGKMREVSAGKDSTTGHWEFAGIHLDQPFPTYPKGFPKEVIKKFCDGIGVEKVLCNQPYSGTQVIADYGKDHLKTGNPIVYTSADSVFQVACHVDVTPIEQLYDWCTFAREEVMIDEHGVGRVIARPFEGKPGSFERISEKRHDYSLHPPEPNLLSVLQDHNIPIYSIGKVIDLFADHYFTQYRKTSSNAEGISQLLSLMSANIQNSFTFINLIDTDQKYGHRQDPVGYGKCLEEIDRALPAMLDKLQQDDLLLISGDHGNDPADDSTDHTREFVPIIAFKKGAENGTDLGTLETFSDTSATILDAHKIKNSLQGESFLSRL
ncbi:MAG: phosphopentomutase [Bacteroidetes bacterium]|jgi:phosphopentomutase|nr:phosphopentomutase [Bacteroidota bacterium]